MVNPFEVAREQVQATPALVINDAIAQRNIDRVMNYVTQHNLTVRPHTKTHKSRDMARRQLDAGAVGLTVAKLGEAETYADFCSDLLVAYPTVDPFRSRRVAEMARTATMRVALDSIDGIDIMADAAQKAGSQVGVLVDLDVGLHRTGAQSVTESLALAQRVLHHNGSLRLDGLFFYPGHITSSGDQQVAELKKLQSLLEEHLDRWKQSGIEARIVSGGSTPTLFQSHRAPLVTEIRPGTSIYNDMNTVVGGNCELGDCSAALICTVVSTAVPGKVVVDGGSKTFSSDRNVSGPDFGHGYVLEYPTAKMVRLTEEHGELDVSTCERRPRLGERLTIIPNHICPCLNLQDSVWLQTADGTLRSLNIEARGRLI